jgi:hemoglobin
MKPMTPYELIGGEPVVARLADRFYELMETVPQFKVLRDLHPAELKGSRDKLFMFLSGWLGGPDLYVQNIGHPRLRARHLPFSIGTVERDQWMACMVLAMEEEEVGIEEGVRQRLFQNFLNTADFMRNREG